MSKKQKLELTWIGKENRPKLEPRILLEYPEKTYHTPHCGGENDLFDNKLSFDTNRERLIESIEGKLQTHSSEEELFTIRWSLR